MYYFKATSDHGVDDYFEASADGVLLRVVSHAGGRWSASDGPDGDGDELHFGDVAPAVHDITGAEFERVWRLAVAFQASGSGDLTAPSRTYAAGTPSGERRSER